MIGLFRYYWPVDRWKSHSILLDSIVMAPENIPFNDSELDVLIQTSNESHQQLNLPFLRQNSGNEDFKRVFLNAWWRLIWKRFSLCEGKRPPPVNSHHKGPGTRNFWCFLWRTAEQTVEQTLEFSVIWDTMTAVRSYCNGSIGILTEGFVGPHRPARKGLYSDDGMETLSASLALCNGNLPVTGGFSSQRVSSSELWCFRCCELERAIEQTIATPVIWDTITFIMTSLPWCVCVCI